MEFAQKVLNRIPKSVIFVLDMSEQHSKYISLRQLERLSGLSKQTLRKRIDQGRLAPHDHQKNETLRFTVQEVERFLGRTLKAEEVQP